MKKHIITVASLAIAPLMLASEASAQINFTSGWSGEASLNGSVTTGNTETTDIGLGAKLQKEDGKWRQKFDALFDRGSVSGIRTRQRLDFGYQIERDFSDRLYGFANASYFDDDFGAFQDGFYVGAGAGYKVILPDPIGWNLEAGAGYRDQTAQDTFGTITPPTGLPFLGVIPGVSTGEFGLRGFSDFDYKFNDNVSLYNDTEILWSDSDTYIWNEVGITAQLVGNLAARASFRVDNHSNPPLGAVGTDTITRFGIVYTLN